MAPKKIMIFITLLGYNITGYVTALLEYLNLFAANNGSGGHTYKAFVYKLQQYGIKGVTFV